LLGLVVTPAIYDLPRCIRYAAHAHRGCVRIRHTVYLVCAHARVPAHATALPCRFCTVAFCTRCPTRAHPTRIDPVPRTDARTWVHTFTLVYTQFGYGRYVHRVGYAFVCSVRCSMRFWSRSHRMRYRWVPGSFGFARVRTCAADSVAVFTRTRVYYGYLMHVLPHHLPGLDLQFTRFTARLPPAVLHAPRATRRAFTHRVRLRCLRFTGYRSFTDCTAWLPGLPFTRSVRSRLPRSRTATAVGFAWIAVPRSAASACHYLDSLVCFTHTLDFAHVCTTHVYRCAPVSFYAVTLPHHCACATFTVTCTACGSTTVLHLRYGFYRFTPRYRVCVSACRSGYVHLPTGSALLRHVLDSAHWIRLVAYVRCTPACVLFLPHRSVRFRRLHILPHTRGYVRSPTFRCRLRYLLYRLDGSFTLHACAFWFTCGYLAARLQFGFCHWFVCLRLRYRTFLPHHLTHLRTRTIVHARIATLYCAPALPLPDFHAYILIACVHCYG